MNALLLLRWGLLWEKCRRRARGQSGLSLAGASGPPGSPEDPGTVVTSGPGQLPWKERTWSLSSQELMTSGKLSERPDSPAFVSNLSARRIEPDDVGAAVVAASHAQNKRDKKQKITCGLSSAHCLFER